MIELWFKDLIYLHHKLPIGSLEMIIGQKVGYGTCIGGTTNRITLVVSQIDKRVMGSSGPSNRLVRNRRDRHNLVRRLR